MRVLVTGGSGYVGSHAIRELAAAGHEVVVYDNYSTGNRNLSVGFDRIEGDIADTIKLASVLDRVQAVMHFAASAYVGESVKNPRLYFQNNVESALKLMDAVLASKVRILIFSSSCAVYGVPTTLPITEDLPKSPINPYGETKLFFERVLAAYRVSHGLRYFALRYFNAAGADAGGLIGEVHEPETHLIPLALKAVLETAPPLTIFGTEHDTPDGTCIRDFIHVSDLATAHVLALDYLATGGDSTSINLGTGKGTSIKELMSAFRDLTGLVIPHQFDSPRAGDPPSLYADPARAKQILGWVAKRDMNEILLSAWKWQQKLEATSLPSSSELRSIEILYAGSFTPETPTASPVAESSL
jgi:UDP-glucose-4-epimerase GalE